jgi:hypothetical protein
MPIILTLPRSQDPPQSDPLSTVVAPQSVIGSRADHHRCCRRSPDHRHPCSILRLIVVSLLSLPLGLMSLSPSSPRPCKPTNQSSIGRRCKRCLGGNHDGVVAGSLLGVEGQAELARRRIDIIVFVGLAAKTVFFRKQPEIDQNQKSQIIMPR